MPSPLRRTGIGLLLTCLSTHGEEFRGCRAKPLEHVVPVFVANAVSRAELLARLTIEQRVCLGVELPASVNMNRPVSLSATRRTVRELIRLILADASPTTSVVESNSIVLITHSRIAMPWASVRIPAFRTTAPAPLQEANNLLRMNFRLVRDPKITGFAGLYSPDDLNDIVGPFQEDGKTVREILALLVRASAKGGAWAGHVGHPPRSQAPWTLVGYSLAPEQARSALLRALLEAE